MDHPQFLVKGRKMSN